MKGSIHHDKHGYKVHFQGRWFRRIKFKGGWHSFREDKQLAEDFLVLVNGDLLRGKYDVRDYTSDEPLAFDVMGQQWLDIKKTVKCHRHLKSHIHQAVLYFGNGRNIKTIKYAELEDFYRSLPDQLNPGTKKNIFATLHSFWNWVVDREADRPNPVTMPKFPQMPKYKPTMRKIVSPEDQARILSKLKEMTLQRPKIYTGVLWCITYGLRFEELRQVKLKDFTNGYMRVWDWKQTNYKEKKLLAEDWKTVKQDKAFGNEWFFRHPSGEQFGKDYLSESIKKAAQALGFFDVVPYAIIKHSTITALSDHYSPEEIQRLFSMHLSPAFFVYLHTKEERKQEMYARARGKMREIDHERRKVS